MSSEETSANSSAETGPIGSGDYTVRQGDCIESIAADHGHFWEVIWDDPANRELRDRRKDRNALLPGDCLHIPEIRSREESGDTEEKHTFRRKGIPARFQIQVKHAGEPRADEPYRLEIDGEWREGRTDGDGKVEIPIRPNARRGQLILGDKPENQKVIRLELGGLDPVTEISGVQARLRNLGYDVARTGTLDERTVQVLNRFQESEELEVTGEPDDATRDKLKELHGS